MSRQRVLLITNSAIGPRMSGPGIRYWELARVLSAAPGLDVTLATVPGVAAQPPAGEHSFPLRPSRNEGDLRGLAAQADVVVAPGAIASLYPSLLKIPVPLVLDLYIPLLLEELQRPHQRTQAEQALALDRLRGGMMSQVRAADFILCADEKQRDYWLGVLSAAGRVNPYTHAADPTLYQLVAVLPFGLPSQPPSHTQPVLKGVYPGIGPDDKVLLWGGGLYDWLDGPTLVRAMAALKDRRPEVKLFFMGVRHPNPIEAQRQGSRETIALADELGLSGRTVFFNDWVDYAERGNYLLEADVGVSLHRDHLETRFSFRTRFLDYIWAGLPVVATRGDVLGEQLGARGLGRLVRPGDVHGLIEALLSLLDTPDLRQACRPGFEEVAAAYRWEAVVQPLAAFCQAPRRAPDKAYLRQTDGPTGGATPWFRLPGLAWRSLRAGGVSALARQISEYRRWLRNRRGGG